MTKKAHSNTQEQGFTLVELSIVLVIIGLLVGGIFVGLDMLAAAQLRGTVSQVEKYNSAVNTFRVKYNGVPGDFLSSYASAFGLYVETTLAGTAGHMDGNGLVEGGATAGTNPVGETLVFWRHMSDANLIEGSFGLNGNSLIVATTGLVTGAVTATTQSLPPTKLTPTQNFVVYAAAGLNYYQILPVASLTTGPAYTYGPQGISPVQAYNMDIKLDDGTPNGGSINAKAITSVNGNASWVATSTAATCLMSGANATDTAATYNRNESSGGGTGSCSLRFRFN